MDGADAARGPASWPSRGTVLAAIPLLAASLLLASGVCFAEEAARAATSPPSYPWFDPAGIQGSLVLAGGGPMPERVRERFMELAGGTEARIVVIPTASSQADELVADPSGKERLCAPWKSLGAADVQVLHARSPEQASDAALVEPLTKATGVWFPGGDQTLLAKAYLDTAVERELAGVLARGGVVGGTSAGAAIQSRVMIAGGRDEPQIGTGFDLLPGAIIDQHFLARRRRDRLVNAIAQHPACIGLGIDEGTALVVQGRKLEVIGESSVTVVLAESPGRPRLERELKAGERHDLTMLRRTALERSLAAFPPAELAPPRLENGALVIAGGGRLTSDLVREFLDLAGGMDAPIVVLPIAAGDTLAGDASLDTRMFERAGATNVTSLRARTRDEVESPEFEAALRDAKGVWFGGGRQWRFIDAYFGTKAEAWLHDVLRRGGVIGGSSAGASIQAQYMVRGSPLGNTDMMAEGYERGLGFLPAAAIDQHFSQRQRQGDMTRVMRRYPQLLGIGIDEGTALIVQGQTGRVVGDGRVYFYDYRNGPPGAEADTDYTTVEAGGRYDLVERQVLASEKP